MVSARSALEAWPFQIGGVNDYTCEIKPIVYSLDLQPIKQHKARREELQGAN